MVAAGVSGWNRLAAVAIVCSVVVAACAGSDLSAPSSGEPGAAVPDELFADGCASDYPDWESSPYVLPVPVGTSVEMGLTNCSSSFHAVGRPDECAYDFDLPEGAAVTAARGGTVIAVEVNEPDFGGGLGNYVRVDHGDGTVGQYLHFPPDGVDVAVGDTVGQGDPIGINGASGKAGYPHLHFIVTDAPGEIPWQCRSVTFSNTDPNPRGLVQGRTYEALPFEGAPAVESGDPAATITDDMSDKQVELMTAGAGREPVTFAIDAPDARTVRLEFTANYWHSNATQGINLVRVDDERGSHTITLHLGPEQWLYRFRVDAQWVTDPANPPVGAENSMFNSALLVGQLLPELDPAADVERGLVKELSVASAALEREQPLVVYTPAGYPDDGPYPLAVLLHGFGQPATDWTEAEGFNLALDHLIAAGEIAPFVVAMPAGDDSIYQGRYGEWVVDDVIGHMNANYDVIDDKVARTLDTFFATG